MRCAVRIADNVWVVIAVGDEGRAVPGVELRYRMQFKMSFARVFGVETEDPAEDRIIRV